MLNKYALRVPVLWELSSLSQHRSCYRTEVLNHCTQTFKPTPSFTQGQKISKSILVISNEFLHHVLYILTNIYWALTGHLAPWIQSSAHADKKYNQLTEQIQCEKGHKCSSYKILWVCEEGVASFAWWLIQVRGPGPMRRVRGEVLGVSGQVAERWAPVWWYQNPAETCEWDRPVSFPFLSCTFKKLLYLPRLPSSCE